MLRGVEIFLVPSCHKNWDKLRPDGLVGSYADLTYMIYEDHSLTGESDKILQRAGYILGI